MRNLTKQEWLAEKTPQDLRNARESKIAFVMALIIGIPLMVLWVLVILSL